MFLLIAHFADSPLPRTTERVPALAVHLAAHGALTHASPARAPRCCEQRPPRPGQAAEAVQLDLREAELLKQLA